LLIIQVYLPSNKKTSNKYQTIVKKIIGDEIKKESCGIILMGDLNAVYDPLTDRPQSSSKGLNRWKPEIELFNFLDDWNFTDVHKLWEIDKPSPTWSNSISHSRIDYIWVSEDIAANNIHSFSNENIDIITNSDLYMW